MEDEKQRKIQAGREKLAKYRKRKTGDKQLNSDSEHSSLSLSISDTSLSPLPLSEAKTQTKPVAQENVDSGSSSISEHIELSNSENDRSLQEIIIASIPLDSPVTSLKSVLPPRSGRPSLNNSLSDTSVISLNALEKFELMRMEGAQNILDEIMRHDQFDKTESLHSNPLDDLSSITLRSERINKPNIENVTSDQNCGRRRSSDSASYNVKEPIVAQFSSTEIDSLREVNSSNPSTLSLGTNTTEYKQCFDKVNLGTIEFQDILSHRDDYIKQLTEALQQVVEDRNNFKEQTDYFAHEIANLKEQLVQATAIIKQNNWNLNVVPEPISNDFKTEHQLVPVVALNSNQGNKSNDAPEINFDFEDPEFNETLTPEEKKRVADMRKKINQYIAQKVNECKKTYESEMKILRLDSEKNDTASNKKLVDNSETIEPETKPVEINDAMFNEAFTSDELTNISELRSKIYLFIKQNIQNYHQQNETELRVLTDKIETEKLSHNVELDRLRQLLDSVKSGSVEITELRHELDEKHNKEMEELRTYFQQRCTDIEKHYSEEIFSQQSRKMSESSVCSELESEVYPHPIGPGGDTSTVPNSPTKDLNTVRLEMQNKYHAELEILREDYENRLDELKINHENSVQEMEQKYITQIDALKTDLEEVQKTVVATQEVASSGDFEIAEVVESYERRLQEQVMLAKIDIISALEQQIQTLVSNTTEDLEWPPELLQLRDRLTEHWHSEIQEIKDQHAEEVTNLKEDHEKYIARVLERERRNSEKIGDDLDVKKERDNLKKVTSNLRHLVADLIKYFTKCEDELNNTLVEELLKNDFDKDLIKLESDFNDSSQSGSDQLDVTSPRIKRVHFTPDLSGIIKLINETTIDDLDDTKDISTEFRTELDLCLERLKSEANAILSLTSNLKAKPNECANTEETKILPDKISSLTRQLISETQNKNELNIQLEETKVYIGSLELEKQSLEVQVEQMLAKQLVLVSELNHAKEKINDLIESGRKEIISEGYGENDITGSTTLGGRIVSLSELQDRARMILGEADPTIPHPLFQLVEELCREGDRIVEDAKKDHEDLVQQIEAADKKLRATTQFLEDQAVDRELERDEAQKEIAVLKDQLRDGERSRITCEQINKEEPLNACLCDFGFTVMETVERLEIQMREMTVLMGDCETKKIEVENELKEAIDKIWVLRDIIRDLESQIEDKQTTEGGLRHIIIQLEDKIKEESKQNEELTHHIDSLHTCSDGNQYTEIIRKLEADVQRLRVSSELVGPDGVLKQVKTQLNEFEKTLEKRTKDLETLHTVITNTSCSSPSEDMSIRDQIRSQSNPDAESDLPLEQLARLKDKLIRHARAEDAAMKRIRDLEMQIFTTKQDYEEMQSERDVLQDQLSEQLVIISSLQLRLDEQRLRVEAAQKQTNTSLEHKVYELENQIQELNDGIHTRDKTIKQLNTVMDQTEKCLAEQQKQLNSASDIEKQIVDKLQAEITRLKAENEDIKTRRLAEINQMQIENDSSVKPQNALTPEFIDTMLTDKNADIDRLKLKLNDIEKELNFYTSLNLTKEQLVNYSSSKQSDVVSMIEISDPDQLRREDISFESVNSGGNLDFKRNVNETLFIGSTFRDSKYAEKQQHSPFLVSELSTIEKVGSPCVNYTVEQVDMGGDSLKLQKHVHFDDNAQLSKLSSKLVELQQEIIIKNETLKSFEDKLTSVSDYMMDIENLRKKLEFSEETLRENTENFKDEMDSMKDDEKNLRVELAEVKMELQQKNSKLEALEIDAGRRNQMYMNLAKEKRDLENQLGELEKKYDEFKSYEQLMSKKNKEIYELERQLAETTENGSIASLKERIIEKEGEVNNLKEEITNLRIVLEDKIKQYDKLDTECLRIKKELTTKTELLQKNDKEHKNILSQCDDLSIHISQLKEILDDRNTFITRLEKELEQERTQKDKLDEYEKKVQELQSIINDFKIKFDTNSVADSNLSNSHFELDIAKHKKELAEKDLQITKDKHMLDELNKEVHHLQDYLNEKDKIINQMTVDSNSLHVALEAIQSKMQESGNVVDLKKRLREEQNLTSALHDELKYLKQSIEQYEYIESTNATETLVMLKESVEKEKLANQDLRNAKEELLLEIKQLKLRLQAQEDNVQKLQDLLDEEKINSNTVQLQDANIIESMRLRLETLLDNENESEALLKSEKKAREELEKQLVALNQRRNASSVSLDSSFKMNDANFEITCIKMDLVKLTTENEILKSELSTIKNLYSIAKSELQLSKELNHQQKSEIDHLKKSLGVVKESEVEHKEKHKQSKREMEQRSLEVVSTKLVMSEIEEEKNQMKRTIDDLRESLRNVNDREKDLTQLLLLEQHKQLDGTVPDKFLHKMRELTSLLQGHIADNKQMSSTLTQLTDERRLLQSRVKELEERLNIKAPYDDPVARADHLFGRYLRSESYRKALVFQKRYLLSLLASYQQGSSPNISEPTLVFGRVQTSKSLNKFRIAVYAVISIRRMQYIVQRWHTGKRIGSSIVLKRPIVSPNVASTSQVGSLQSSDSKPWSGHSPPCKDRTTRRTELPLGTTIQESITLAPLEAPALLSQYIERFDSIQQRLGLAVNRSST